jgi:hypothetical protein
MCNWVAAVAFRKSERYTGLVVPTDGVRIDSKPLRGGLAGLDNERVIIKGSQ